MEIAIMEIEAIKGLQVVTVRNKSHAPSGG